MNEFNTAKPWHPPVLDPERRVLAESATDAQLDQIADEYAEIMLARGFKIGKPERDAILRMAAIHDAWRVAFKRVLGS
jgi:hypothetical protein